MRIYTLEIFKCPRPAALEGNPPSCLAVGAGFPNTRSELQNLKTTRQSL